MGVMIRAVLLAICFCLMVFNTVEGLKIAAYNVRVFGQSKLKNAVAKETITKIVKQYDIVLIQEVRGVNLQAPNDVGSQLLTWVGTDGYSICNVEYNFKPATGTHRELYLYLYRHDKVKCLGTVEAESLDANPTFAKQFRRPPTIARFQSSETETKFFVVGIHTQPSKAVQEINALVDVYNSFLNTHSESNFQYGFIMGDFNYGGSYVNKNFQGHLAVDKALHGVIGSDAATSVKTPGKPYDRIYVGPQSASLPITSSGVDTFRNDLSEDDYYRAVSDHYPVYIDVAIGGSGGVNPTPSPAPSTDAVDAAQQEECNAVLNDSHTSTEEDPLEPDEEEFLDFCTKSSVSFSTYNNMTWI